MGGGALSVLGGGGGSAGDKLTGGSKSANKASKKQLAELRSIFEGLNVYGDQKYGEAMKSIEGVGKASKANALSQENQYLAHSKQNLGGLYNSTVANSAARGIHSDTLRVLGSIDEDTARMRANLLTGQAGFHQGNTFNLASILGGVQHQSGTNYLAELMKIGGAAAIFCDRRMKTIVDFVGMAWCRMGNRGFPIYRFYYNEYQEAGIFEGPMAQDVQFIPGVVMHHLNGMLLVDADALYRTTGVQINHVGTEVSV